MAADIDGRLADGEDLVDGGQYEDKGETNCPCADGGAGDVGIVGVFYHCTDGGVGAVEGYQGQFDLDLLDEGVVIVWVAEDVLVCCAGVLDVSNEWASGIVRDLHKNSLNLSMILCGKFGSCS